MTPGIEGLEGEQTWLLSRVETVRQVYRDRVAAQRHGLEAVARAAGWGCLFHRTDRSPESALLALYGALAEPGHR